MSTLRDVGKRNRLLLPQARLINSPIFCLFRFGLVLLRLILSFSVLVLAAGVFRWGFFFLVWPGHFLFRLVLFYFFFFAFCERAG